MDIEVTETFDGGDFVLIEVQDETGVFYDIQLDGGLSTAIYLSHFGGNVEASTTGNEKPGDLRKDFWGNALIAEDPDAQANSELERVLLELPITSGNLLKYEDRAKLDLTWMLTEGIAVSIENEAIIVAPEYVEITDKVEDSTKNADVVATDTWVSMGDEAEKEKRIKEFQGYTIDQKLMKQAKPDAIFMHCLPAYYDYEVTKEVAHGPQSVIFDEAENRMWAQIGIMVALSKS